MCICRCKAGRVFLLRITFRSRDVCAGDCKVHFRVNRARGIRFALNFIRTYYFGKFIIDLKACEINKSSCKQVLFGNLFKVRDSERGHFSSGIDESSTS